MEKINIEDAEIIEETTTESSNNTNSNSNTEGKLFSKEIDPDEEKEDKSEKVKIDFMSDDYLKDQVKKETKTSEEKGSSFKRESQNDPLKGKTLDDIQKEVKTIEDNQQFTKEDFRDIAKAIVDLLDTGIVTSLRLYGGSNSDREYTISKERRERLEFQVTLLLIKYQSKLKIEFVLLATLVLCYWAPYQKARENRKSKKSEKTKEGFNPNKSKRGRPKNNKTEKNPEENNNKEDDSNIDKGMPV